MIGTIEQIFEIMTKSEINSMLKSKFVRIRLGKRNYCFRVLLVREIFEGETSTSEIMKDQKGYRKRAIFIKYNNRLMPVIDLRNNHDPETSYTKERSMVIVVDAIGEGLLLQFGIQVNNVNDIINSVMSEISEEMIFGGV